MTRSNRRLRKRTDGEGENDEHLYSASSESIPEAPATDEASALLVTERTENSTTDFMDHFSQLASKFASESLSRENPSLPARSPPGSCQSNSRSVRPLNSLADPNSEENTDFYLPKRSARAIVNRVTTPIGLHNSFSVLSDDEDDQETTPAPLQPIFKEKPPPQFPLKSLTQK